MKGVLKRYKMRAKARYKLLRRWQSRPAAAAKIDADVPHTCANCKEQYVGNYCPRCGQSANTQRFTLRNAISNFLELWGLANSTFTRTVVHLVLRPGHMIRDFIKGHRQPYFPPIRMLFIVVATFLIVSYLLPQYGGESASGLNIDNEALVEKGVVDASSDSSNEVLVGVLKKVEIAYNWFKEHVAITLLLYHTVLALIATWLFRKSPRLPNSTVVENFYAQTYICCQLLIFGFVEMLLTFWYAPHEVKELSDKLALLVYFVDYRQLYGMRWWPTIWRTIACFAITSIVIAVLVILFVTFLGVYVGYKTGNMPLAGG